MLPYSEYLDRLLLEDGSTVLCNAVSETCNHGCFWDDMIYQGQGEFIGMEKNLKYDKFR
jgi:hypothetical protein